MRGLLLAFEGLDKTGKTSQCKLLYSHLKQRGIQAHLIHFPVRDSTTGVVINRYLKNQLDLVPQVSHLLFSANRWEMRQTISRLLNEKHVVILDRYIWSGKAYSMALGLDERWVDKSDQGLHTANLTFYMQNTSNQKTLEYTERYEEETFQNKVERYYQKLIADNPNKTGHRIEIINSEELLQTNHYKIRSIVESLYSDMCK